MTAVMITGGHSAQWTLDKMTLSVVVMIWWAECTRPPRKAVFCRSSCEVVPTFHLRFGVRCTYTRRYITTESSCASFTARTCARLTNRLHLVPLEVFECLERRIRRYSALAAWWFCNIFRIREGLA